MKHLPVLGPVFELYKYVLETSVLPREPEPLKELREVTAAHPLAVLCTSVDSGQLGAMLLQLVNSKRTIEVGVFTGYFLLLTALTIPEDGKVIQITAIDSNRETFEIRKAGVEHKIDYIESQALAALDKLLTEVRSGL